MPRPSACPVKLRSLLAHLPTPTLLLLAELKPRFPHHHSQIRFRLPHHLAVAIRHLSELRVAPAHLPLVGLPRDPHHFQIRLRHRLVRAIPHNLLVRGPMQMQHLDLPLSLGQISRTKALVAWVGAKPNHVDFSPMDSASTEQTVDLAMTLQLVGTTVVLQAETAEASGEAATVSLVEEGSGQTPHLEAHDVELEGSLCWGGSPRLRKLS